ncbi:hypothetical protein [Ralstonia phage Reminis]|uniref:Uncharacterized protein n=1 Tax=Ralstonia phage Reminis TaxID=2662139 RepID=A0A5Q2UBZ6_9CAUD|nr:hypothetical protein [Ralstonia phage Reminis]
MYQGYIADFALLEQKIYSNMLKENKRAKRLPARKRKFMYGNAKQPFTFIHDCIQIHGKARTKHIPFY